MDDRDRLLEELRSLRFALEWLLREWPGDKRADCVVYARTLLAETEER